MVGTIIYEVGTIMYDIGIINVRFYLLKVRYPHEYCKITRKVLSFCKLRNWHQDGYVLIVEVLRD